MAEQKLDDQLKHTYSSYERIRDGALKTCRMRRRIGRSCERGSGIFVLAARHDDDINICLYMSIYICICKNICKHVYMQISLCVFVCVSICIYVYIYHHHYHHVMPPALIFLTLSRHFSLSFITFLSIYIYVCVCVCICECVTHTHTHIHTHTYIYIYIYGNVLSVRSLVTLKLFTLGTFRSYFMLYCYDAVPNRKLMQLCVENITIYSAL